MKDPILYATVLFRVALSRLLKLFRDRTTQIPIVVSSVFLGLFNGFFMALLNLVCICALLTVSDRDAMQEVREQYELKLRDRR